MTSEFLSSLMGLAAFVLFYAAIRKKMFSDLKLYVEKINEEKSKAKTMAWIAFFLLLASLVIQAPRWHF